MSGGFKYREVERKLMGLFNIPESQHRTFRGRIRHFQRLGVVPSSPGKGQRIEYGIVGAWRWCLAIQLNICGVGPSEVAGLLDQLGEMADGPEDDEVWLLRKSLLGGWSFRPQHMPTPTNYDEFATTVLRVGLLFKRLRELMRLSESFQAAA